MIKVQLMDNSYVFACGTRNDFYNETFLDKDKLNADILFISLYVWRLRKTLFGKYRVLGLDIELFNINAIKRVVELEDDNTWYEKYCI